MDKETLSNYGWIVIAVLVLVVMIALATPFGTFVSEAVQSTTKGLFDVNKNALNAAGVPGLTVQDQEFDVPDMNHGTETPVPAVPGATFTDGTFLTWEELKLEENGTKYGYNASVISDTEIGEEAFMSCTTLVNLTVPEGVISIGPWAFDSCENLSTITIPASVTSIDGDAFMYTDNLKSISVDSNNPNYCTVENILYTKDMERLMWCPTKNSVSNLVIPNGVKVIGDYAFYWNESIESITLPYGVTTIENNAFTCVTLDTIILPHSLTQIQLEAFDSATINTINYTGTEEQWNNIDIETANGGPIVDGPTNYNYTGK